MSGEIVEAGTDNFGETVTKSGTPVVVMFYSEECPPCDYVTPVFEHAANRYKDKLKFVKIFRQQNRELAERLKITTSPTLLFYNKAEEVCQRLTGYINKPELRKSIEAVLGGNCPRPERLKFDYDAIILGGGPAGLTAAMYMARAKLKTIVVDEGVPGGQVNTTFHISNYPGTGGTVKGAELMVNMVDQAMSFGATIDSLNEVLEIDLQNEIKYVKTENGDYYSKCVILSTGAEPKRLPAEGEREYRGRGVHYCATCDGPFYQDRKIIVVGGGNSAVQEAIYLTRFASHVTIIHQMDHFQASQVLQDELFKNPNIEVVWDSEVRMVKGDAVVKEVVIENIKTKQTSTVLADGVFVYIGMQPRTDIFKDHVTLNEWNYINTDDNLQTNLTGVFAAGDVRDKQVRQIATAVGDGAVAGLMAEKYVFEKFTGPSAVH
ncbi:MAG TPA: thioredoxin-disulfide reductase [Desulfobacteria bacterium]|nr:thioredoxin-disulfide reductase [Desulfobacteria bacterium]